MCEITAAMVKELRDRTDAPLMSCKSALIQTNGNINEAENIVREIENEKFLEPLRLRFKIKKSDLSNIEIALSKDGNCPECNSVDWKTTKMVYQNGLMHSQAVTEGSGTGLGIGIGRGRGGVDITMTNYEENSSGMLQSELSRLYSPPSAPKISETKQQLISDMRANVEGEAKRLEVKNVKQGWWPVNIFDVYESRLKDALAKIEELEIYEKKKLTWDKGRVCQRCGTLFIKNASA